MAKTILIPTDFRVESLNTLKKTLSEHQHNDVLNIILIYSEYLSGSIVDMLFYSPYKSMSALIGPEFKQALSIIENRYHDKINSIKIEPFHSNNKSGLKNFIEANDVQEIYYPKSYNLKLSKSGFNPIPLLKKSKLPLFEIHWENDNNPSSEDNLATLFI